MSNNYTQKDHKFLIQQAIKLFKDKPIKMHPDYHKEKVNRIKSVKRHFVSVHALGLDMPTLWKLNNILINNDVYPPAFSQFGVEWWAYLEMMQILNN